jgi:hypothetical protein
MNSFCRSARAVVLIRVLVSMGFAQTSSDPELSAVTPLPSAEVLKDWRAGMVRVLPPKRGCFTSSYPSGQWREIPCTTAPAIPFPAARGPRANNFVGNGYDVSAEVTDHITMAIGSFDGVSGVTSESGNGPSPFGGPNSFSLQLNSNFFPGTPACNSAAVPSVCMGWAQFVFSNSACEVNSLEAACAFIAKWLIGYGKTNCPGGWTYYNNQGDDECYIYSPAAPVPPQAITNLINLSLIGQAVASGSDTVIMAVGGNLYSSLDADDDLQLAGYWQQAEFNIFGDGDGSQANFNSGSTIVVRTSVDHGSAYAPSCNGAGFTGETNNLSFVSTLTAQAGPFPAMVFAESYSGSALTACAFVTSLEGTTRFYQQGNPLVGSGYVIGYQGDAPLEGSSVALSSDGNTAIIGGPGDDNTEPRPSAGANGAAWVFTRSGSTWTQQAKLVGTDLLGGFGQAQGWSVALSADGNTAILGGGRRQQCYRRGMGLYQRRQHLDPASETGW